MAVGMKGGATRQKRRHRRKLCCGDDNPAHVASGRLQSFPVKGAFASAKAVSELSRTAACDSSCLLVGKQGLLELHGWSIAQRGV